MKTDIAILTKNPFLLETCLSSLNKVADLKSIGSVVVGITDKNAMLDCCDVINHYCNCVHSEIVEFENYHYAKNNNMLANDFCKSECITFMNDDVELTEDPFKRCLNVLENDNQVGTVGIQLLYPSGLIQHAGLFYRFNNDKTFHGIGHIGINKDAKFPDIWTAGNTGAFLMLRKDDFNAVGGFDEDYKVSFQDVQLNMDIVVKLNKKNLTLNTIKAIHKEKQTRGKSSDCIEDIQRIHDYFNGNIENIAKVEKSKPRFYSIYC